MDIYSFIRSQAVAEHCRSIGKTWNTLEMAVIIDRSNRTITEKHAAWMELVENHPDMAAIPNYHDVNFESVHAMIVKRIAYENHAIEWFKTPENGVFYEYHYYYRDGNDLCKSKPFATLEKALAHLSETRTEDEILNVNVYRIIVGDAKSQIYARSDHAGHLCDINAYGTDEVYSKWFPNFTRGRWKSGVAQSLQWYGFEFAKLFFIDIPVPFEYGDILIAPRPWTPEIFVLIDKRENPRWIQWYERSLRGEISDGVDMQSWGYFVDDTGTLYKEHTGDYDEFEYYKGELQGKDRLLYYVRLYLLDELELHGLLTMQGRLVAEQLLDSNFKINSSNSWFLEHLIYENRNKET